MTNKEQYLRDQAGFVGVVFVAIAVIGLIVASIASMARGSSSGVSNQTTKTVVSTTMKQAADLKSAMEQITVAGGVAPGSVTFDNVANTGIFNPVAKYAVVPSPPPSIFASPTADKNFKFRRDVKLPTTPATAPSSIVAVLGDISLDACRSINSSLYGDALTATPAVSVHPGSAWYGATDTALDDTTSVASNYLRRPEGCIRSNDSKYVYYKVLAENSGVLVSGTVQGGGGMVGGGEIEP